MKFKKRLFIFYFLFVLQNISYSNNLDYFAVKHGTDKSSKHHDFTSIYETYFSHLRNEKIDLLEIGLAESCSALMWEDYFPHANLYFIDSDMKHIVKGKKVLSERSKCLFCDQGKRDSLEDFIDKVDTKFDIIIDDGGHLSKWQILSFEMLFPVLKTGGIYIIEDLNYAYWKNGGGLGSKSNPKTGPGSSINYLKNLVDDLNFVAATDGCANINFYPKHKRDRLNYYRENIKSIHFYSSLCLIIKR